MDQVAFLVLVHALGELAVMTKLGGFKCHQSHLAPTDAVTMSELAEKLFGANKA